MLVYAQPIIDLRTGAQVSSELLVRMRAAATFGGPAAEAFCRRRSDSD